MDRYKKIHKESDKFEKRSNGESKFAIRKEREKQQAEIEPDNPHQEEYYQESPENIRTSKKKKPTFTPNISMPKKKGSFFKGREKNPNRKKSSWKKRIAIVLLLFFGLEAGSFFLGKYQAETDASIPQQELVSFDGVSGDDGSNNILLLGSDTREGETARADTIMVVSLDSSSGTPKLVSFMRDTYANIPGYGYNKVNAAYAFGGADLVRQTLYENFGVQCRYYAIVDFSSFEKVIDALFPGGVAIDAEKDLDLDGVFITAGQQNMDGHTLLQYARFRMDEEGDFGRVRRQQQVMTAIFSQIKNPFTVLRLPYAAGKVLGYTSTDVSFFYLLTHLVTIARGSSGIERLTVPVEGSWSYADYPDAGSVLDIDEAANYAAVQAFLQ